MSIDNNISSTDLENCLDWIKTSCYKKVCLQFPQHLMNQSVKISLFLKKNTSGVKIFIIGDPTLENCCIDNINAFHVQADALIHFGHACLSTSAHLPTFYVFEKHYFDVDAFCHCFTLHFKDNNQNILIFYEPSLLHAIEKIREKLKLKYPSIIFTDINCKSDVTGNKDYASNSLVLGRKWKVNSEIKLEQFLALYIGSHKNTLQALSMSTDIKEWFYYDNAEIKKFEYAVTKEFKKRYFLIEKIKEGSKFCLLIGSLNLEDTLKIVSRLKWVLNKVHKKVFIITVGKLTPEKLANFAEIDIFVAINCPEVSLKQYEGFFKPIVIPYDVDVAFNSAREFSDINVVDFRQILPNGPRFIEFLPNSQPDISLASGKIVGEVNSEDEISEDNNLQVDKISAVVATINTDHTVAKTWYGLEQVDSMNKPIPTIEKGREGIPLGYKNEKN